MDAAPETWDVLLSRERSGPGRLAIGARRPQIGGVSVLVVQRTDARGPSEESRARETAVAAPGTARAGTRRAARRFRPAWFVVLGLLLAGAGLGGWRIAMGKAVAVHVVERKLLVERVVATGRVMAPAQVKLGALVLGRVARVNVDEGSRVRAGDVLLELDDTEARAALGQARAAVGQATAALGQVRGVGGEVASERLKAAEARLEQARSNYERSKKLSDSGAGTAAQLEEAQRALAVAETDRAAALAQSRSSGPGGGDYLVSQSAVAHAEAGRQLALARLEDLRLVAPADGVVLRRAAEPGDVVQPGQTLLLLARDGATRLVVQVDENNLGALAVGQPAMASADAFPGQRFAAKVLTIAPSIDADRGTVEVKLEVAEPPAYLRPDMTVSVDVEVGRRENAMALPLDALRDGSAPTPWVLVIQGRHAVRRPVVLGVRTTDQVEIRDGLGPGELVVVPGSDIVAPGDRVRPKPADGH
jgi:HlyD family secretion protein